MSGRHPPDGRELLSTAEKILMAARGCSDVQAFDELLDVAQRHHMTVQKEAEDLVGLAAGPAATRRSPDADCYGEWEKLLTQLSPRRRAS
ncbi:MAG: ANTAR domain-containing protein [Rhodococcus sp. (in: high G+C Gram-positive bacteria)]